LRPGADPSRPGLEETTERPACGDPTAEEEPRLVRRSGGAKAKANSEAPETCRSDQGVLRACAFLRTLDSQKGNFKQQQQPSVRSESFAAAAFTVVSQTTDLSLTQG
jgi:hypothetical protein